MFATLTSSLLVIKIRFFGSYFSLGVILLPNSQRVSFIKNLLLVFFPSLHSLILSSSKSIFPVNTTTKAINKLEEIIFYQDNYAIENYLDKF